MGAPGTRRIAYVVAAVAVVVIVVLLITGGGDDDVNNNADRYEGTEAEVAVVVDDFANAGRDGDGTKICEEIFTTELVDNVERESGQSCPSEVQEELPEGEYELEIDTLEMDGDTATVGVTEEDGDRSILHMTKVDAAWRIARVTPGS